VRATDARQATRAARHLEGFLRGLSEAGLRVPAPKRIDFLTAVTAVAPANVDHLYWVTRVTLLSRIEDLQTFDDVFAAWFRRAPHAHPEREPPTAGDERDARTPRPSDGGESPAARRGSRTGVHAATAEIFARKKFRRTDADARDVLAQIRRSLPQALPTTRARRTIRARTGSKLDLPKACREANRNGGEVVRLYWRRRPNRTRPLLLLIDVSGSVKQHSPDMLRFAHASVAAAPRTETFTFGTRFTRVTEQLRTPDVDGALSALAGVVLDADAGTRIGTAFDELLGHARYQALVRGALVVVLSDGLERGDCGAMVRGAHRLSLLAHRFVWWSPLACSPEYRPVTLGMRGALASIDELSGARDLESVLRAVHRLPALAAGPRRSAERTWSVKGAQ
jgi:uncharacterized protein